MWVCMRVLAFERELACARAWGVCRRIGAGKAVFALVPQGPQMEQPGSTATNTEDSRVYTQRDTQTLTSYNSVI